MGRNHTDIGVIEGFYGRPWSWQDREDCLVFLQKFGFSFYIYAPKNDLILRENWQDEWPQEVFNKLQQLSNASRAKNIKFGIGFSPFEIDTTFDQRTKERLREKIRLINRLQPEILCVLFDDMKGDNPKLAEIQANIFEFSAGISTAKDFILCPSYYTFDPLLEQLFGKMPDNYLKDMGKLIDPSVHMFWTGPRVFSPAFDETHLREVADLLRRKPFVWDNYPVNDAPSVAPFLRLRPFSNRPYQMGEWTSGHAINPMNQSRLSQIPMLSLMKSYTEKASYDPETALIESARAVCGAETGDAIVQDISLFQDKGLENLTPQEKERLEVKYTSIKSPYAEEVLGWLRGDYKR